MLVSDAHFEWEKKACNFVKYISEIFSVLSLDFILMSSNDCLGIVPVLSPSRNQKSHHSLLMPNEAGRGDNISTVAYFQFLCVLYILPFNFFYTWVLDDSVQSLNFYSYLECLSGKLNLHKINMSGTGQPHIKIHDGTFTLLP